MPVTTAYLAVADFLNPGGGFLGRCAGWAVFQPVCANLTVEIGHFPSWPWIEIRKPCISSSQILSTVPAFPSVRITALPTSSV
jgi:hypothetical protein